MKKLFVFLVILACLGLIGWRVYQKVSAMENQPARPRPGAIPIPVNIEPVQKTSIREMITFTGTLYPKTQFNIAPKVGGRLESLLVNIGDVVQQGQLIAVLDDDEYVQQMDQAKAELEVAEARIEESRSALDIARRELERAKELRQKNIASQSSFDTTQARYDAQVAVLKSAQAQFAQKEAALKAAEIRLSYTRIHASWTDGDASRVVGERFVDEGALLTPNAPIVSILENNILTAVIFVIERDYPKIRTNQKALIITDAFPEKHFDGKVVRVAPILKETSRQARVDIEVPNSSNLLKPGMFIRIEIELDKHDNAIVVPLTALVKKEGVQGIFMVDAQENKARFVPITLGIVQNEWAEIIKPPLDGLVVTLGQHLLEDGSPVILPGAGPKRQPIHRGAPPRSLQGERS